MFNIVIPIFFVCFNYACIYANCALSEDVRKKFVIVTASYNSIDFVDKYLESVFSQKCDEKKITFRVIYYDDCSTDGTGEFVEKYKKKLNLGNKLSLIRNSVKVGAHENIYHAVHSCDDDEIVLIVDGDDWLARNDVLEILHEVYSNSDVWITYGQLQRYPSGVIGTCHEIPEEVIKSNSFRSYPWTSSHLRTFYAWLYKRIKMEDIMFEGKFVPVCGDVAIMFPMLEMAGTHLRFISEILYIYNCSNPNSYWSNRYKINNPVVNGQCKNEAKTENHSKKTKIKLKKSDKTNEHGKVSEINDLKKMDKIRQVIERHIRKEIIPYAPLLKSDLHV